MNSSALVMFDYDGVIVDSLEVFSQSYIAACQENGLMDIKETQDVLALFEHNIYKTWLQRGIAEETINRILTSYERMQFVQLGKLTLFDGMADALNDIYRENKVFIITSNLGSATESVLQRHGVKSFEEIIGAEKEKSKINKIKTAMERYNDCLAFYVGDTKGDMIEGKEAGAITVGVSWGWHSIDKLQEGGADFIVHSPQQLVDVIYKRKKE